MSRSCEQFEEDCERRAHGALGEAEGRALDEHLAGCERCRGFAALVSRVDAGMQRAAAEAARSVDWGALERRIDERARRLRRSSALVAPAMLGAAGLSWAMGLPPLGALVMAAAGLLTALIARSMGARWLRDLSRAQASREGLLEFSRRQVDEDLRAARWGSAALALLGASQMALIEVIGHRLSIARVAVHAGGAVLLLVAAEMAFRQAPRLRREREELR